MNPERNRGKRAWWHLRAGSIRQRLTFFIFAIILSVILVLGYISYLGVRKAALHVAQQRLKDLSAQLATALKPDTSAQAAQIRVLAGRAAMKQYLASGGKDSAAVVHHLVNNLRYDSLYPNVQIFSAGHKLLWSGRGRRLTDAIPADSIFSVQKPEQQTWVGKLYAIGDTVLYPVIVTVYEDQKAGGYLVRWRRLYATAQSVNMLTQLMGKAALYLGNMNDTLWTDVRVPVHAPDIGKPITDGIYGYKRTTGDVISGIRPIPNSPWLVSVEISESVVFLAANRFLYWLMLAGLILLGIGIAAAILLSRSLSRPLVSLTHAAARIAEGNFGVEDTLAQTNRKDEIGRLAQVFGAMSRKIHVSREELEKLNQSLEVLVNDRTRQLQLVNEELESFTYSVSHDLRAPLRAILGYSHILSEDHAKDINDDARACLDVIKINAMRMGTLIDELLAFSKLGRKEIQRTPIDFAEMVTEVLRDIERSQAHKAAVRIHPLEPAMGDDTLLRQVWQNLISNAIKYSSGKEKPEIEIGSSRNGDEVIYYIKDNGAGFDMQYISKLFGVFQRLHHASEFEGTGIGLALVQRIINKHGGRVWASGEVGKGAIFYFTLSTN